MIILFYISGFFAVLTTLCVLFSNNPIHALLYLIFSLLCISCNLFSLQAPFAGAMEIIIYAGAIMVLFIFVIMMLNIDYIYSNFNNRKFQFSSVQIFFGVLLLMGNLLTILLNSIFKKSNCFIDVWHSTISCKKIGIALFGPYMLVIEIASFLLLSALISVLHITQEYNVFTNSESIQFIKCKK